MTTFTAEQKSQLAKLMATENLTVQHQKIRTARFDPQNRVLYLPIWQNMTGVIYDLLCGHEVGHALYTPAEGWHDAVTDKSKPKAFKGFLNVVEDARIEKKVKRKYPGLSASFKAAYQQLIDQDFFGIKGRDINELCFVDRLNLYSKSQWSATWVNFTANEQLLVKKVQAAESWEDVVRISNEIFEYSKSEQMEMQLAQFEQMAMMESEDGDYDYDDEYGDDEYGESGEAPETEGQSSDNESDESTDEKNDGDGSGENTGKESKSETEDDVEGQQSGESDGNDITDTDESGNSYNRWKNSEQSWRDQFTPSCETDDKYRQNEGMLLDEKCKEYVYINLPKPIISEIVTPAKTVQTNLTLFFKKAVEEYSMPADTGMKLLTEFKNKNDRYIGLLAKEFEMRKAAKSFSKSKLADTGDIDINKLAGYKFDDNIFRKVMLTPKGKNHGLVLLLDKSGSMSGNMAGSIEQILVLAMFCRKVNIPFVVYGFGDAPEAHMIDNGIDLNNYESRRSYKQPKFFTEELGELACGEVYLREYINNKMTNAEFTAAMKNMVLLKKSFECGRYYRSEVPRPDTEHLGNTPLNQAIVAMAEVMKNFKRSNNLDITSLVIVHDGDSDHLNQYFINREYEKITGEKVIAKTTASFDFYNTNVILSDKANKVQIKLNKDRDSINESLLTWFTKVTGSKVFGFFIISNERGNFKNALQNRYTLDDGVDLYDLRHKDYYGWANKTSELTKKFRSEKFLISKRTGFASFYLISGGTDLNTEQESLEVDGKFTARKLATAFARMNKKKAVNRVLVSQFIQGIAA